MSIEERPKRLPPQHPDFRGGYDLVEHIFRAIAFSRFTFGPGVRTEALCKHIEKELKEIQADPFDVREWIDIIVLGIDGAWRCLQDTELTTVQKAQLIAETLQSKQRENEGRKWPDWKTVPEGTPIEHVRGGE